MVHIVTARPYRVKSGHCRFFPYSFQIHDSFIIPPFDGILILSYWQLRNRMNTRDLQLSKPRISSNVAKNGVGYWCCPCQQRRMSAHDYNKQLLATGRAYNLVPGLNFQNSDILIQPVLTARKGDGSGLYRNTQHMCKVKGNRSKAVIHNFHNTIVL
jgi:hypothetical protein